MVQITRLRESLHARQAGFLFATKHLPKHQTSSESNPCAPQDSDHEDEKWYYGLRSNTAVHGSARSNAVTNDRISKSRTATKSNALFDQNLSYVENIGDSERDLVGAQMIKLRHSTPTKTWSLPALPSSRFFCRRFRSDVHLYASHSMKEVQAYREKKSSSLQEAQIQF